MLYIIISLKFDFLTLFEAIQENRMADLFHYESGLAADQQGGLPALEGTADIPGTGHGPGGNAGSEIHALPDQGEGPGPVCKPFQDAAT